MLNTKSKKVITQANFAGYCFLKPRKGIFDGHESSHFFLTKDECTYIPTDIEPPDAARRNKTVFFYSNDDQNMKWYQTSSMMVSTKMQVKIRRE